EPWFPCKENDCVLLADGTMGRVITQTPEVVQLMIGGGSYKTYRTEEFLNQNPTNISKNFRVNVTFGIDYQYQSISTTEIPEKLREMIEAGLINEGYGNDMIKFTVEFSEIGDSSLNYVIFADFSGRVAKDYNKLSRIIQKLALDTCNKFGWEIPYTTFTIHTAPSQYQQGISAPVELAADTVKVASRANVSK
ncbi:MAG: mechanosensitive ion channel family protein, partial [Candidatus Jettenia caeni]|nr:mechanosensitive ion channel family protein [Candidatus Jettenia caeni]